VHIIVDWWENAIREREKKGEEKRRNERKRKQEKK